MKARVELTKEISFDKIWIGDITLSEMFAMIHSDATACIQNISIERQSNNPNYEDIDSPIYSILNLIEQTRGY